VTGKADLPTIAAIKAALVELIDPDQPEPETESGIRVTGDSVNIRSGPGEDYGIVGQAKRGDMLEPVIMDGWRAVLAGGEVCWISVQYSEVVS
jgi:uncharacterized protein YgiM (DUF1202 family)